MAHGRNSQHDTVAVVSSGIVHTAEEKRSEQDVTAPEYLMRAHGGHMS